MIDRDVIPREEAEDNHTWGSEQTMQTIKYRFFLDTRLPSLIFTAYHVRLLP